MSILSGTTPGKVLPITFLSSAGQGVHTASTPVNEGTGRLRGL
jgi:hypothetical protein